MELSLQSSYGHGPSCFSIGPYLRRESSVIGTGNLWIMRVSALFIRWISVAILAVVTVFFAIGGALAGVIAGGLAGWASGHGVFRGAILLAMGGASVCIEFLDAIRYFWSDSSALPRSSSMEIFFMNLIHNRFAAEQFEQFPQEASQTYLIQGNSSSEVMSTGLSADRLKNLPCHVLLEEIRATQRACCTICLQDIGVGDTARSLPQCNHVYHLSCVDQWLIRHGSCPVCRQRV